MTEVAGVVSAGSLPAVVGHAAVDQRGCGRQAHLAAVQPLERKMTKIRACHFNIKACLFVSCTICGKIVLACTV